MYRRGSYAHWFLRLALFAVFFYHGITKFPKITEISTMLKMSGFLVVLVALMETSGAVLILLGGFLKSWMSRLGAFLLIPVMLGAIFKVHWGQWSFMPTESHPAGGIELQVVLLAVALYLFIKGNKA